MQVYAGRQERTSKALCLRTRCCGEYVDPEVMKQQECWKELHEEELHNFYSSPNTIKTVKSRRMRYS
jgi:hypothetical protein